MYTTQEIIRTHGTEIKKLGYGRDRLAEWLNENLEGTYTGYFARRLLEELEQTETTAPASREGTIEERLRAEYNIFDETWVPVGLWGEPDAPRAKWERRLDLLRAERLKELIDAFGEAKPQYHVVGNEGTVGVLSIRDTHFGMFTSHPGPYETYDLEEAEQAYIDSAFYLMERAAREGVSHLVIPFGSDTIHIDGPTNTTTKGTPQDVSTVWWEAMQSAIAALNTVIEHATQNFEQVTIVLEQGNHDNNLARALAMAMRQRWEGKTDILDGNEKIKYVRNGNVHLFFDHGDTLKPGDYPAVIYADYPGIVHKKDYVEVLTGHLHHRKRATLQQAGDYWEDGGLTHRITPALCPSSDWAEGQGYRSLPGAQLTVYDDQKFLALFDWTP